MTTTYKNIKTTIFSSKEHYLNFRKQWCKYVNSEEAKPYYIDDPYNYGPYECGKVKRCNLHREHHLLFCILTETCLEKSFKPSPTGRKEGFKASFRQLTTYARMAKMQLEENPIFIYEKALNKFLEPFGGHVTIEMLASLYLIMNENEITNVING